MFSSIQKNMTKEPQTPIAGRTEAETVTYTSLRDVLPLSKATPGSAAQESVGGGWRRFGGGGAAMRNPLVMQAALAYLQPVGIGGGMCGRVGCFDGVVLTILRGFFGNRKGVAEDDDDDDDDDDEEDDDEDDD